MWMLKFQYKAALRFFCHFKNEIDVVQIISKLAEYFSELEACLSDENKHFNKIKRC